MNKKARILFLSFLLIAPLLHAQNAQKTIPEITEMKSSDLLYKEYSYIVEDNYKNIAAGRTPDLIVFKHTVLDPKMTLIALASRCNIPYDTIATLNSLESSTASLYGKSLLLPTAPGLFIRKKQGINSLEILLQERYFNSENPGKYIYYNTEKDEFIFLINGRFTPTERAYFLDSELRLPINKDSYWISSEFGKRKNPVSGEWKNHNGIDLAAAEGTPVFAIKDGFDAICYQNDPTFGNYIILSHDDGAMTSIYAHLSKIAISNYDSVKKGDIIGYVGSTGMATGPHLHFEIRKDGVAQNPSSSLRLK